MSKTILITIAIVVIAAVSSSMAYPRSLDSIAQASLHNPTYLDSDLQPAASGHHGHGRVHIKVYRGPSDGHHAAHGFWVKQPADDRK